MLSNEVSKAHSESTARKLVELSVAYLRFLIVTPSYLSMMFQKNQLISEAEIKALPQPDDFLNELIEVYAKENGWQNEEIRQAVYTVKSMLYGTALIIRNCEKGTENEIISDFRSQLEEMFK